MTLALDEVRMTEQDLDFVDSCILSMVNACNKWLDGQKQHLENNPCERLFDYEPHAIPPSKVDEIKGDKVTFVSPEGLCYTLWLPQYMLYDFKKAKAFKTRSDGKLEAKSITVWNGTRFSGIAIAGNDRWFNVPINIETGDLFAHIWRNTLPDGLSLTGTDAYRLWCNCHELYKAFEAAYFSLAIQRDTRLLTMAQEDKPYLLEHPAIQTELTVAFKSGGIGNLPKKMGSPLKITKEKLELYHWVYYYLFKGLSKDAAYRKTVLNHRELLPKDWKGDPEENLKKQVERYDKIPSISQKKLT
jgi:hypothetical protein